MLEGRYCRLEPLAVSHRDALYAAVTGPEADRLHRWLFEAAPESRAAFDVWLAAKTASNDPLFFAVVNKATGSVEGRQTLMRIDTNHGVVEIGNILWGPRMAGTRIATEAQFLFADWVFGLGYRRYEWKCNALNAPSRRAALRFGFTFEGIFRQHMVVRGENRDTAWYAILDHEWPMLKKAYQAWLDPANLEPDGQQKQRLEAFFATK
jgi:RimJ/RimL family protein N-acetyltransferase